MLQYVKSEKSSPPLVLQDRLKRDDFEIEVLPGPPITRRANLKIQDGCDFMCAYCIVPFARGRSRSRDLDNLVAEAECLVRRGAKELVLTGVNLGCYDHQGHTVLDVVQRLNLIEGLARIRISSIELTTIPEGLMELMDDPEHKLVPFLHIPLQFGSDRIA